MTMRTGHLSILLCILSPVLCCEWLTQYAHRSSETVKLIKQMAGPVTVGDSPVAFPYSLYRCAESSDLQVKLEFIRDVLNQIYKLYDNVNSTSITWDSELNDNFLMILNTQIEEIADCVSLPKRRNRQLRKYFSKLKRMTLKSQADPAQSWGVIHNVIETHLKSLHMLVASILKPSATRKWPCTSTP